MTINSDCGIRQIVVKVPEGKLLTYGAHIKRSYSDAAFWKMMRFYMDVGYF